MASAKSGHKHSELYSDIRKIRIKMIIALLCFTMNPTRCFIQTLLGLVCYSFGMRDGGFDILNTCAVTCSVDHIRRHGHFWSNQRNAIDELDKSKFWRLTIDNLDFKIKYAKKIGNTALNGVKKMLNLITGQVSTRTHEIIRNAQPATSLLTALARKALEHTTFVPISHKITENDFKVHRDSCEDFYYLSFSKSTFASTMERLYTTPMQAKENFILSLQKYMPHWTPKQSDHIVYATIEEAQAGNVGDVEKYLTKLKQDLKIGEEGFPTKVVIGGDQQTYAIMKNLQRKYTARFRWYFAVPGDWHLLKLVSEVLRDMLWDGGLREFSYKCGQKSIPKQWQDIHLLLLATYESLLRKATV